MSTDVYRQMGSVFGQKALWPCPCASDFIVGIVQGSYFTTTDLINLSSGLMSRGGLMIHEDENKACAKNLCFPYLVANPVTRPFSVPAVSRFQHGGYEFGCSLQLDAEDIMEFIHGFISEHNYTYGYMMTLASRITNLAADKIQNECVD